MGLVLVSHPSVPPVKLGTQEWSRLGHHFPHPFHGFFFGLCFVVVNPVLQVLNDMMINKYWGQSMELIFHNVSDIIAKE